MAAVEATVVDAAAAVDAAVVDAAVVVDAAAVVEHPTWNRLMQEK